MVNSYKGTRVDAGVADHLRREWFADSSAALDKLMAAAPASPEHAQAAKA
jgi:hypothetical protein